MFESFSDRFKSNATLVSENNLTQTDLDTAILSFKTKNVTAAKRGAWIFGGGIAASFAFGTVAAVVTQNIQVGEAIANLCAVPALIGSLYGGNALGNLGVQKVFSPLYDTNINRPALLWDRYARHAAKNKRKTVKPA